MRWAPAISANFLGRIAEPASPFHKDYLAYQNREITRAELISRLPHVAMIGDSVCTSIYISSLLTTFWRARTCRGKNWFLDTEPSPLGIRSVSKRLEEFTPFVAREYAGIGAMVVEEGEPLNFFRRILGTRNFSGQVDQLLSARRFPDLAMILIGHNNVDWVWRSSPEELEQPEDRLKRQARSFGENFGRDMRRLIAGARLRRHRVAIVIYGLVNFESFFKAREAAERLRAKNNALYPYLDIVYEYFTSMRPAHRRNLARLALMINEELRGVAGELQKEIGSSANVQVRYSDALATADLSRLELIHAMDAWHPSAEGHDVLAEAAFSALAPALEFLGLKPRVI